MSVHHGKQLKYYLFVNELLAEDLAATIGRSRAGIYKWYDMAKFSEKTLSLLKEHKIDFLKQKALKNNTSTRYADMGPELKAAIIRAERAEKMVDKLMEDNSSLIQILKGITSK